MPEDIDSRKRLLYPRVRFTIFYPSLLMYYSLHDVVQDSVFGCESYLIL